MGRKIPDSIRQRAIDKWLEGRSRDKIAEELQISQGVVSDILNVAAKNDPRFHLLREVAITVKKLGMDIESFAPLVRLRTVLRDKGVLTGSTGQENLELMQNRLEAAVVSMEEFLFRKDLSFEDFFSLVTNIYNLADKVGVPLNQFPSYIEELKDKIDVLRKEINQAEKKMQDFQNDHKKILESLQEYAANKPFLITLENLQKQLADAKGRIHELEGRLDHERHWYDLKEQEMGSAIETKLEKAKRELIPNVELPHSMNMIKDVFKHPDRYMGVISRMRDIYCLYYGTIPDAN